jgi:hypothetical protein
MGNKGYFDQLVLWDGENTYWTEEMKPSDGYKNIHKYSRMINARFVYIGEL